jgi:uncharacterized protein involved in exopolysaccharide biosynthesis
MTPRNTQLDITSIVFRKWKMCLLWAAPFAVLFVLMVLLIPKKYVSEMKIFVSDERQDPVISTDYTPYSPQARQESELQVNSESQLLRSSDVLQDVALSAGLATASSVSGNPTGASPLSLARAVTKLNRDLTIEPVKKSQIINVSYMARSPELANRVLTRLARRYFEAHVQVHNTGDTYQLFDEQAAHYASNLTQAEADLTGFRKVYSFLVMPEEQQLLAQRATEARAAFEEADAQVAQIERRIKAEVNAMTNLDTRVVTQQRVIPDSDLAQRLSSRLIDLKNQRTEVASKFREDDRLVIQLDHQIADTQAALERTNSLTHTENTTDLNVVRQASERDFMADRAALAGAVARREKMKVDLARYREEMSDLAGATVKQDALLRAVKASEDNFLLYSRKREQARIEHVLDQSRVANVAIAQQPTLTVEPASPKLILAIPLALFLACGAGIAIACGSEYLGQRKTFSRDPFLDRRVAIAS